jgi:hypothetical protein
MARPKIHILNTDSPIMRDGLDHPVNCGIVLRQAKRAFTWDEIEVGEMISVWPTGTCRQCANLSDRQNKGRKYVYGLVSGRERDEVEDEERN